MPLQFVVVLDDYQIEQLNRGAAIVQQLSAHVEVHVVHRDKIKVATTEIQEPWVRPTGCLCVVGCTVNGQCPVHGDNAP